MTLATKLILSGLSGNNLGQKWHSAHHGEKGPMGTPVIVRLTWNAVFKVKCQEVRPSQWPLAPYRPRRYWVFRVGICSAICEHLPHFYHSVLTHFPPPLKNGSLSPVRFRVPNIVCWLHLRWLINHVRNHWFVLKIEGKVSVCLHWIRSS